MTARHEQWLRGSEDDLAFAVLGLEHGFHTKVCFLSQQASEKALKAILIARTGHHPRLHNLVELLTRCGEQVQGTESLKVEARILDQYYLSSRYPDGVPDDADENRATEVHAREALDAARKMMAFSKRYCSLL